jgi:hypothetical protein
VLQSVTAERPSAPGWKQRIGWSTAAFGKPGSQRRYGACDQRRDAILSTFAAAAHVRPGTEMEITAGQPEELGAAQPGLDGQLKERVVASTGPCRSVWSGK